MENVKAKAEEIISVRKKELERRRREQLCLLLLNLFADITNMVKTIKINIANGRLAISAVVFGGNTYNYPQDSQKMPNSLKENMAEISKVVVRDKFLEWVIKVLKEELGAYISIQQSADKTIT